MHVLGNCLLRSAESNYDLRCVRYRTCRCSRIYPFDDQLSNLRWQFIQICSRSLKRSVGGTVAVSESSVNGGCNQSITTGPCRDVGTGGKWVVGREAKLGKAGDSMAERRSRDLDFAKPPLV